jgi:hypothetical protein
MDDGDRRVFSADLPDLWLGAPGDGSQVVSVRDILLAAGDANVVDKDLAQYPPILMPTYPAGPAGSLQEPQPLDLGFGVTLLRLDHEEAERVINACSPRGHYFHPIRQFGQLYTFTRDVEREDWEAHLYRWDTDDVLTDLLAVSRLILDHGYSTEFAARVIQYESGEETVMPLYASQPVYRLRHTRDWFIAEEIDDLRTLLAAYRNPQNRLPRRVGRAFWNLDYGFIVRWLDIRLPLLVIAFEGLISTSTSLVRRQFIERVPQVCREAGADDVTTELCKEMYDARSRWAHGSHISLPRSTQTREEGDEEVPAAAVPDVERVVTMERGLGRVVRRCVEEPEFALISESEESIRDRWPVRI